MIFYPLLDYIEIILSNLLSLFISPYLRSIIHTFSMEGNLVELLTNMIMTSPQRLILTNVNEKKIPNLILSILYCKSMCFLLVFLL